jgi:hypothetical protein
MGSAERILVKKNAKSVGDPPRQSLHGLSHQIRFVWKLYHRIALIGHVMQDNKHKNITLPLIFNEAFKVFRQPNLNTHQSLTLLEGSHAVLTLDTPIDNGHSQISSFCSPIHPLGSLTSENLFNCTLANQNIKCVALSGGFQRLREYL